jgi:hypothetical protein
MLTKKRLFNYVVALSLFGSLSAHAQLIGPNFPAPGGTTYIPGGTPADGPGGATNNYSGFNTSFFSSLYWGADSGATPTAGLDNIAHPLTLSSIVGDVATFTGTTSWLDHNNGLTVTVPMELLITVTGLGATPWVSFAAVNGSDPFGVGAVVDDSAGNPFTVNLSFLANVGSGYQAMNTIAVPTNYENANFYGAFYSAVPLPASFWLMLSALGTLVLTMRRRPDADMGTPA